MLQVEEEHGGLALTRFVVPGVQTVSQGRTIRKLFGGRGGGGGAKYKKNIRARET